MAVQAFFSRDSVDVAPGAAAVLQLNVVNLGDRTETFALAPAGMAAGWTLIRPATITLFGGSQQEVDVEVRPPLLPSTAAGATALTVRIVPQSEPDEVATAETSLIVGGSFDRRLHMLQPALRARRTAVYEMMLENRGNTQASCRLRLVDPSSRVEGDFDPPAAGVEPGASTLVRLKLHATHLQWERRSRTVPFRIDADQSGVPTATAQATFVQAPMLPERLWGRLLAVLLVLGALAGAWFGLVKPEIRTAARDAVRDETPATVTTLTPTPGTETNTSQTTVVTATTLAPDAQGDPFTTRLAANVPAGQTGTISFTVPAGKTFLITDFTLQNPNTDTGIATVLRGTEVLYTWRLDNIFADLDKPLVSPIEFKAGEVLNLTVTCAGSGDPTVGACVPALQVVGRLVAAP